MQLKKEDPKLSASLLGMGINFKQVTKTLVVRTPLRFVEQASLVDAGVVVLDWLQSSFMFPLNINAMGTAQKHCASVYHHCDSDM